MSNEFLEPGRGDRLMDFFLTYNESQDEYFLKLVGVPFARFEQTLTTQLGAGVGPDILQANISEYVPEGLLAPLSGAIDPALESAIDAEWGDLYVIDGVRYALPFAASGYALLGNEDLLDKAGVDVPTTWEELLAASLATTP